MKRLGLLLALATAACSPKQVATYSFLVHVEDKGGTPPSVEQIDCIIERESGGDPRAWSHTDDRGLFQINAPTWQKLFPRDDLFDPVTNGAVAAEVYVRAGGWSPWAVARWCR